LTRWRNFWQNWRVNNLSKNDECIPKIAATLQDTILKTEVLPPGTPAIRVKPESLKKVVKEILNQCSDVAVSAITGVDLANGIELNYHIRLEDKIATVRTEVPKDKPHIETIADIIPGAKFYERELYDLLGVSIDGNPDPSRLVLPETFGYGEFPLRKEWKLGEAKEEILELNVPSSPPPQTQDSNGTIKELVIGPQHPALVEPEKFT